MPNILTQYQEDLTYEAHDFGRNIYNKHIYKLGKNYNIHKSINGVTLSFGSYPTFEEAREIRDLLIENDWNIEAIQDIIDEKNKAKNYYKYIRKNNRYYAIAGIDGSYMGQVKTIEEALYYRDIIHNEKVPATARPKDYDLTTNNPYLKYGLEVPLPERLILNVEQTKYGTGYIMEKGPQSYHVWYGSTYYCACPTYEMAYYMKQELNKCGWDKSKVPEIMDEYPVWYTWLNNFWKFVTPAQHGNKWNVNLTPKNTGYEKFEHLYFRRVEDALWERDQLNVLMII